MTDIEDWTGRNIPEVVLQDAAAWLALLDSDRCNAADRLAFARWLAEDRCHQWAYEELSEVWARLHTLADVRPLLAGPKVVSLVDRASSFDHAVAVRDARPRAGGSSDWTGLAAAVLVVAGFVSNYLGAPPTETLSAAAGETLAVSLADGSTVELDAGSEITVRIDDDSRYVTLEFGDAVFHVAADPRPFVVKTPRGSVAALGTSFAVTSRSERTNVAVLEGSVRVWTGNRQAALTAFDRALPPGLTAAATVLNAGEGLAILAGERRYHRRLAEVDFARELSWRNGVRQFSDVPLGIVVSEMRRYYDANILIASTELATLRISGRFRTAEIRDFIGRLDEDPDIVVDLGDPRWIILRPAS